MQADARKRSVNRSLHAPLFSLPLLNYSQNIHHSPSYPTLLSPFKGNFPGSGAMVVVRKSPVLYLRDEQGRSDKVQKITSKPVSRVP